MSRNVIPRDPPGRVVPRILSAAALTLALLLGTHAPASAQSVCTTHAEVVKTLGKNHAEVPVGIGLADNGGVVQVFSTTTGTTWTIVITMPNGMTCLVAAGESWEFLPPSARGPKI